jgi:hypothetical protein
MARFGVAGVVLLAGILPARADEMPARKAGLWEVKTSFENRGGLTVRQCIDARTDQMMMSTTGPLAQSVCPKREIQRSGNSVTIDAACTVMNKTATTHAVVTGNFDSAYVMTVTAQGEAMPSGAMTMTMTGKWLGPCAAGQKPGDMIMPDGRTLNILEGQAPRQGPDPLDRLGEPERRSSWWCWWPLRLLGHSGC